MLSSVFFNLLTLLCPLVFSQCPAQKPPDVVPLTLRVCNASQPTQCAQGNKASFFDFSLKDGTNRDLPMSSFAGKVVLITNVATFWGRTTPTYLSLNALSEAKRSAGLRVLGIPCNQFGLQEPAATHTEILNGIRYVRPGRNFVPNFPVLAKTEVNGDSEEKVFTFMKCMCAAPNPTLGMRSSFFWSTLKESDIRWNFEKFLIDKKGRPRYRFSPAASQATIQPYVDYLLAE